MVIRTCKYLWINQRIAKVVIKSDTIGNVELLTYGILQFIKVSSSLRLWKN